MVKNSIEKRNVTGSNELAEGIASPNPFEHHGDWLLRHHCRQSLRHMGMTSKCLERTVATGSFFDR